MNTNLSFAVDKTTNESLVPPELLRAGSATVRSIIDIMMLYGVDKIDVGQSMHGTITLISPRIRLMKVNQPTWLEGSRKQAVFHLSHLMLLLGLLGVELLPDEEELNDIQERWRSCERQSSSVSDDISQLVAPDEDVYAG